LNRTALPVTQHASFQEIGKNKNDKHQFLICGIFIEFSNGNNAFYIAARFIIYVVDSEVSFCVDV
jgi:hypothetical protein